MPQVDRHEAGTPSWFDLMTPDPEKARAFYSKLFGWDFSVGGPEFGGYTMFLKAGKPVAGMGPMPQGAPYPTSWSVYFETPDADASCASVTSHGGQVMMPPMDVGQEGRMAMCQDPSGAVFGYWQAKNHTGAKINNEASTMAWCEVNTRDGLKVRDFYTAVMGTTAKQIPGMNYWTLEKGRGPCYGVLQMDEKWPEGIPAHWMAYFAVEHADTSCEVIKANNGKVVVAPFDSPHGRIAVVQDPFGATFSVVSDIK